MQPHRLPLHDINPIFAHGTNRPASPDRRRPVVLAALVLALAACLAPAGSVLAVASAPADGTSTPGMTASFAEATPAATFSAGSQETAPTGRMLALAAGQLHSLLVHADGRLFAFGDNTYGQLGTGSEAPQSGLAEVVFSQPVQAVAAGAYHSLVLTDDGSVHAFGRNAFGQLGNGSVVNTASPQAVEGLPPAAAIAAGAYHSLVLGRDGSVWAFGDQTHGQCGAAVVENVQNEAGQLVARRVIRPQRILPGGALAIAAGSAHSLVLLQDGSVLAFGANDHGQLGDGSGTGRSDMKPVAGIGRATMIAAGSEHSMIVTEAGDTKTGEPGGEAKAVDTKTGDSGNDKDGPRQALLAFGDNSLGQLGIGSSFAPDAQARSPVQVDWATSAGPGYEIRLLAAGYGNTLLVVEQTAATAPGGPPASGAAVRDVRTARVLSWGSNAYGQLGVSGDSSRDKPIRLQAVDQGHSGDIWLPFEAAAIGGGHVLLASRRGLAGGAGRNGSGQLGMPGSLNERQFIGISLPGLSFEATPEASPSARTLDQLRESWFGPSLQDRRSPDKVLPLQVPWDTAYAFGADSVSPPSDPRLPYLYGSAVLLSLAALLAVGCHLRFRKRPTKRPPAADPSP